MFSDESDRDVPPGEFDRARPAPHQGPSASVGYREWPRETVPERQKRWDVVRADGELVDRVRDAMRLAQAGADGARWTAIRALAGRVIQSWMGVLGMEPTARIVGQPSGGTVIQEQYDSLREQFQTWAHALIIAARGATGFKAVVDAGENWGRGCFSFAAALDPGAAMGFRAGLLSWSSGLDVARARVEAHAIQAEAATLAMALFNLNINAFASDASAQSLSTEIGNAARLRRMRARRRSGMIGRVSVSLYRGDVALLRKLGILPSGETSRDQQGKALEAFLLFCTLARNDAGLSWKDRSDSQTGRSSALGLSEGES